MMLDDEDQEEIFRAQMSGRMRALRKASGKTQDDAAAVCRISPRSYKDYELGRKSVPTEVVVRFCKEFGTSPDELLFGPDGRHADLPRPDEALLEALVRGLLIAFASDLPEGDIEKRTKLALYAWGSAQAKRRTFEEELKELHELTQ